jgi:hypothetical protein
MKKIPTRISDQWFVIKMGVGILDDFRFLRKRGQKGVVHVTHVCKVRATRRSLRQLAELCEKLAKEI